MSGKIYRYWLMVPSGLEEVALDELRERVPQIQGVNVEPGGRTGQIFFTFKRSPQQLAGLQAAMQLAGVVAQMHRVTVGQPGLDHLCDRIAKVDFAAVANLARSGGHDVQVDRFALSATLQGRYRFGQADVIRAVARVLREKHGMRQGQGGNMLRLHLQLNGRRGLLGIRLGPAIAPSAALAFCLFRLLGMQAGTHLLWSRRDWREMAALERHSTPRVLIGIDEKKPARREQRTLAAVAKAGYYPLKNGCMDYALRHVGKDSHGEIAELARILRFGGVGLVQVSQAAPFLAAMDEGDYPFVVLAHLRMRERGRPYELLVLERLEEYDPDLIQVSWEV